MIKTFWAILSKIKANLVWTIPLSMLLGLAFGSLVNPAFLKVLIFPLTFIMIYPMMIKRPFVACWRIRYWSIC